MEEARRGLLEARGQCSGTTVCPSGPRPGGSLRLTGDSALGQHPLACWSDVKSWCIMRTNSLDCGPFSWPRAQGIVFTKLKL